MYAYNFHDFINIRQRVKISMKFRKYLGSSSSAHLNFMLVRKTDHSSVNHELARLRITICTSLVVVT